MKFCNLSSVSCPHIRPSMSSPAISAFPRRRRHSSRRRRCRRCREALVAAACHGARPSTGAQRVAAATRARDASSWRPYTISKLCGQLHVLYNADSQSHERLMYSMRRTQFYITGLQHIDTFGQTVELLTYGLKSPTSF